MDCLFAFPPVTRFEQRITKTQLTLARKPTAKQRRELTAAVERVTWSYVLAPHTLPLAATTGVPEVDVLSLKLRTRDCPDAVLAYLDAAIPKPLLFELAFGDERQLAATYKRPSRSKPGTFKTYDYYRSAWVPEGAFRQNLPPAIDLGGLYETMLYALLPVVPREGEGPDEAFARAAEVMKLERQVERLRKRVRREKQFNLRVELNAELRELEGALAGLR